MKSLRDREGFLLFKEERAKMINMELDKERDILKQEIEKTTAAAGRSIAASSPAKKVGIGIRTYAADIADIMRREKGSVIKIALAEQARRKSYKEAKDPTSTKNLIIALFGVIFIVAGILIFVYTIVNRDSGVPIAPIAVSPSLLYTENQTQIDMTNLTRGKLFEAIHATADASFAENETITNMMITSQSPTGRSVSPSFLFLSKLGIRAPDSVIAALSGQFMLGTYRYANNGHLFLILRVKDFNQSFDAMKEWEVSLANDLVRLFRIDPLSFSGDIFFAPFVSSVVSNKEARSLYDEDGTLVLSYIYLDGRTILITNHGPSVDEVLRRINSQSIR